MTVQTLRSPYFTFVLILFNDACFNSQKVVHFHIFHFLFRLFAVLLKLMHVNELFYD